MSQKSDSPDWNRYKQGWDDGVWAERQRIVSLLMIQHEAANKDEELLRQAFDAIVNVLAGADYDDPYASLREAAKALSDRLGGGLK